MSRRASKFALVITLTALLSLLGSTNAAYSSGSPKINPRICPSAAEVASGLHIEILARSAAFSPRRGNGLWSVELCEYLTNIDNRTDVGPAGLYGTHVVIQYSWPMSKNEMGGKESSLSPPVENVPHLGDIAFGQVKYHFLYAGKGTVGMSLSTPETAFPQMIKFARLFF